MYMQSWRDVESEMHKNVVPPPLPPSIQIRATPDPLVGGIIIILRSGDNTEATVSGSRANGSLSSDGAG